MKNNSKRLLFSLASGEFLQIFYKMKFLGAGYANYS